MAKIPNSGGITEALETRLGNIDNDDESKEPPIDDKDKEEWNKYIDWLQAKGLRGHPSLDKDGLGNKMILKYKEENPNTTLSVEKVKPIQKEFLKYRDWSLGQIKAGKAAFGEGVNEDNYMKNLSNVDGLAGQYTTSFQFPSSYLKYLENNKLQRIENQGFATVNK